MKTKTISWDSDVKFERLIVNGEEHSAQVMEYGKTEYNSHHGITYRLCVRVSMLENYAINQPSCTECERPPC